MRKFLLITALAMLGAVGLATGATITGSVQHNFSTNDQYLVNKKMGGVANTISLGDKIAGVQRMARVVYDVTDIDQSGVSLGSISVAGHGLGVSLPAKAVITKSWAQVVTPFVSNQQPSLEIMCEDANNIIPASNFLQPTQGYVLGAVGGSLIGAFGGNIASACRLTGVVQGGAYGSGRAIIFVEYVVGE